MDRRELLEQAVSAALSEGCEIKSKSDYRAVVVEPKRLNVGCAFVLSVALVFAWGCFGGFGFTWGLVPVLCQALVYLFERDKAWQISVDEKGAVLWDGEPVEVARRRRSCGRDIDTVLLFILWGLYCVGGWYLYRYTYRK